MRFKAVIFIYDSNGNQLGESVARFHGPRIGFLSMLRQKIRELANHVHARATGPDAGGPSSRAEPVRWKEGASDTIIEGTIG